MSCGMDRGLDERELSQYSELMRYVPVQRIGGANS